MSTTRNAAVTLSSDGSTALIGIQRVCDKTNCCSGSAYIFTKRADGTWSQQAKLTALDGTPWDSFGSSVSLSTQGNIALIGATYSNDVGAAYIFVKEANGRYSQQAKLSANNATLGDVFGYSVSLSSDGTIALIGAPSENALAGSAYVFTKRIDGIWSQQAKLTVTDSEFGIAVSLSSNGSTALIGAYCDDGKGRCSGSAYIFTKGMDGNWRQQAKLTAADGMAWDYFGGFMSLSTDGSTALVGVWSDDFRKGSAYLFVQGTDGNWRQQAKLSAADSAEDDEFNVSIALSGDSNMALIGAFMDDDKRKSCGSTYIFGGAPVTVYPLNTAPIYKLLLL